MIAFPWLAVGQRVAVQGVLLLLLPVVLVTGSVPNGFIWLNLATGLVLMQVSLALHEGAHAGAGWLLGYRVRRLVLGQGPLLLRWRKGSFELVIRAIPLAGLTMSVSTGTAWPRLGKWLKTAAGPALNVLLAWWFLGDRELVDLAYDGRWGWEPSGVMAYANAWLALVALVPAPTGMGFLSDGAVLLTLPFSKEPATDPRAVDLALDIDDPYDVRDFERVRELCERALMLESPLKVAFRVVLLQVDAERGQTEKACDAMSAELDELPKDSPFRPVLLNNLAWYTLELERRELLPAALGMAEESHKKLMRMPWSKGTLGALLVASGHTARGERLLKTALDYNERANGRAHNAAWLAIAAAQRGRRTRAERWLELARQLDPECRSLRRAERALAAQLAPTAATS